MKSTRNGGAERPFDYNRRRPKKGIVRGGRRAVELAQAAQSHLLSATAGVVQNTGRLTTKGTKRTKWEEGKIGTANGR